MQSTTYQEELRDLHHRRVYHITLVGGILTFFFAILDYIIIPEHFADFLDYRIAVAVMSIALLIFNYLDKRKKCSALISFTEYLLISFVFLLIIYHLGGDSPYYVGIIVAMTIYSTLAPLTAIQTVLSGLFIVLCYGVLVQLSNSPHPGFSPEVFNNLFFMICFVFIIATQSWAESNARENEFQLRQQELEANQKLSHQVTTLEEEVKKRTILQAATEERYRLLFEQIADDVAILTDDAEIIHYNRSFKENYLSGNTVKVTSFYQIVIFQDQKTLKNLLNNVLTTERNVRSCTLSLIKSDGSTCETEINISLVERTRENPGMLLVIRDISTRKQLEKRLFASLKLKKQTENAAIMSLARLSEFRDVTPKNHLERVREFCRILAIQLSRQKDFIKTVSPDFIQDIYHAAVLHDIGKVSIPDDLWEKRHSLTALEEVRIRSHTIVGGDVIRKMEESGQQNSFLSMAKDIAYFHHERWDGNGFPYSLKEEEIPLAARIMAVADTYEELTAVCKTQDPTCHENATEVIMKSIGLEFDPRVVEALFLRQEEFKLIRKKFAAV
ncbi:MAG: HD domain-containing phosphohydrolase [Desulforhopalus sp.]